MFRNGIRKYLPPQKLGRCFAFYVESFSLFYIDIFCFFRLFYNAYLLMRLSCFTIGRSPFSYSQHDDLANHIPRTTSTYDQRKYRTEEFPLFSSEVALKVSFCHSSDSPRLQVVPDRLKRYRSCPRNKDKNLGLVPCWTSESCDR